MSLEELYPSISPFTKILILTKLETGTAESFDIEIARRVQQFFDENPGWR